MRVTAALSGVLLGTLFATNLFAGSGVQSTRDAKQDNQPAQTRIYEKTRSEVLEDGHIREIVETPSGATLYVTYKRPHLERTSCTTSDVVPKVAVSPNVNEKNSEKIKHYLENVPDPVQDLVNNFDGNLTIGTPDEIEKIYRIVNPFYEGEGDIAGFAFRNRGFVIDSGEKPIGAETTGIPYFEDGKARAFKIRYTDEIYDSESKRYIGGASALHEYGHIVDNALRSSRFDLSAEGGKFKLTYTNSAKAAADKGLNYLYFINLLRSGTEHFAQGFSMFYFDELSRTQLRKYFPDTYRFFEDFDREMTNNCKEIPKN